MINKLPRWAWGIGICLASAAGIINAVGFLNLHHQAVTHVTGTVSLLGIALSDGHSADIAYFSGLLLAFIAGCALSGFIVGSSTLMLGRRYSLALLLETGLLLITIPLLKQSPNWGLWSLAGAAGLQNAMTATYSGALVRTSHMTGIVTDIGTYLGQWLGGHPIDKNKAKLYLVLLLGFLTGSIICAWKFAQWQEYLLLLPAALTLTAAISYEGTRRLKQHDK